MSLRLLIDFHCGNCVWYLEGIGTMFSVDLEVRGTSDQVKSDPDASQRVGSERFWLKLDGPWRGGSIRFG